ncbi:MAG: hypothetical protein CME61_06090 [Halobacteriovoraceae bacterium]|nr:hypothetical protein [Halobacteriovoraceae bacterium]|tara:strand:- start:1502 stop:1864 length:363 start_codon:yes stop_codon:yes gene_type:complete
MLTIFYDSNCTICTNIKTSIELLDLNREIILYPIQDEKVFDLFPQLNFWDCRKTIHLVDENGTVFKEEYAIIEIFKRLPLLKNGNGIYKMVAVKKLIKSCYKYLNLYRLKKVSECDECEL